MFLSMIDGLPTTSYIKMIEVWLIFTLIIPFMEVLTPSPIFITKPLKMMIVYLQELSH